MNPSFPWWPVAASDYAGRVDTLFLALLALSATTALTLMVLIIGFCVRYRRGARVDRSHVPVTARRVEVAWTVLPMLLFILLFGWAAFDFLRQHRTPGGAMPLFVVAKQWMWTLEHENGRREINELHVPQDRPVRLLMTSQDVIHSFFVPALRVKQDLVPGRYTTLSFTPTRLGVYELYCAEYCGTEHSVMRGRIVVMPPAAFSAWLAHGAAPVGMAARGAALFREHGCSGCHTDNAGRAPPLAGVAGSMVELADGRRVLADDDYLRAAIIAPRRDIVAGYAPLMPSYAGQLSEQDVLALIAYLHGATHEQQP